MKKYYEDARDNAAFDRCIDVMARMVLKYGPKILEMKQKDEKRKETSETEKRAA